MINDALCRPTRSFRAGMFGKKLELAWIHDRIELCGLGDNESYQMFGTNDYDGASAKHKEIGVSRPLVKT
jgi:hypothetical protein